MRNKSSRLSYFWKTCLGLACALLFSACDVTFINPLPDSLKVERDERLSGKWTTRDEEGHLGYAEFVSRGESEFDVHFEAGDPNVVFRVSSAKIDGSTFMIIKTTDAAKKEGYFLAKYVIKGDKLKVWLLDEKKVRQAVRDGRLKGEIGKETYAGVTITDSAEKILAYLKTAGDDAFKVFAAFEKVAGK
ncbi:MAG TPA: hypothetical protein VF766_12670 [Pyrinomonadaceae bacterium]